jgi:hypothetical protein
MKMKLPFGRSNSGRLVHIGDVPDTRRGRGCDLVCPECAKPLIAYLKDDIKIRHFGHAADAVCVYRPESWLHEWAKQLISERKELSLPTGRSIDDREIVHPTRVRFDDVQVEVPMQGIKPDLIGVCKGRPLLIEILVTHASEETKLELLKQRKLAAVEIDVSRAPLFGDRAALDTYILDRAPRVWLFNPRIESANERYEQEQATRRRESIERILELLRKRRDRAVRQPSASALAKSPYVDIERSGLAQLVGKAVPGAWYLSEHAIVWQSRVVFRILKLWPRSMGQITPGDMVNWLSQMSVLPNSLAGLTDWMVEAVRQAMPDFVPPRQIAANYIGELAAEGLLTASGYPREDPIVVARQRLEEFKALATLEAARKRAEDERRQQEARDRAAERAGAARRKRNLRRIERAVMDLLQRQSESERPDFKFNEWVKQPLKIGATPEHYADMDFETQRLIERIEGLEGLFTSGINPPKDLLNLPLNRVKAERETEFAELERIREKERSNKRIERLIEFALPYPRGEEWVFSPNEDLGSRMPAQLAEQSEDGLESSMRLLRDTHAHTMAIERLAADCYLRLVRAAEGRYGEERAPLWLERTHVRLQAKPRDYCRDEASLARCLEELERDSSRRSSKGKRT